MRSLKITQDNDLALTAAGDLDIVTGKEAILQNTVSAMRVLRGKMPLNALGGMPYDITVLREVRLDDFDAAARAVILNEPGVQSITRFDLNVVEDVLRFEAEIVTVEGTGILGGNYGR